MSDKELDFEFEPEDIFDELTDDGEPQEEAVPAADTEDTGTEGAAEESAVDDAVAGDIADAEQPEEEEDSFDFFSDDEFFSVDDLFADDKEETPAPGRAADVTAQMPVYAAPHTDDGEEEEEEKKGPSVIGRVLSILIPAILVVVILVSGGLFLRDLLEYRAGEKVYDKLDEFVSEAPANSFIPDNEAPVVEVTGAVPNETVHAVYPRLTIDYDALQDVNGDFVGVLYVPALELRYPVVKSRDNTEYLSRTFEGTRNSAGSIFLDMNASMDLSDSNSIIFGHNMKNGTMFGSLQKFLQDDSLAESDPYFYIYQSGRVLKYRIFAYYTTPVDSGVYTGFQDEAGYGRYVAKAISSSAYKPADTFDFMEYPPMVVLSTCYGSGHIYNFVVHGVLQETIIQNRN